MAALTTLGSCVAPSKAPPPPRPAPSHLPAPRPLPSPPPKDWRDAPQTPGTWNWSNAGGQSVARFAPPGGSPIASLTCDRASGLVLLARQGHGTGAVPMQISTSAGTRPVLSEPARSQGGTIAAALRPRDPLLDTIAFSRGRFAFEAAGEPTLYLPSWPELSRVIEDCR
ncbi:MAG: hypothetical protein JSR96_11600 [Proteobacteria bacterium]|nr:hypothetical protein [Pseudomonadota bacterium]